MKMNFLRIAILLLVSKIQFDSDLCQGLDEESCYDAGRVSYLKADMLSAFHYYNSSCNRGYQKSCEELKKLKVDVFSR